MKAKLAYIDDDPLNLECIKEIFEDDNFEMDTFQNSDEFLNKFGQGSYACILSDIHMPVTDGFSLYEKIIAHIDYNGCPILFISSDDSDKARIRSLTLGAVDFIGRLINPEEMIARVKSKIQFFENHRTIIEFDQLKVNLTLLKTSLNGEEVPLTFIELKMVLLVLRSYPDAVSKEVLIENIWKLALVQDATIYTHIFNLNSKLTKWNYEVQAVKSRGVQLVKKENKK